MISSRSRAKVPGYAPHGAWRVLFQKEEFVGDQNYQHSQLDFDVQVDDNNWAAWNSLVYVAMQDSPDGVVWTTRASDGIPIVMGGERHFRYTHRQRFTRVLVFEGNAVGVRVFAQVSMPEPNVTPLWPDLSTLACATRCEVDCETGAETVGWAGA